MESNDGQTPALTVATTPTPRQSYFREVSWRWSDVLIGIAPSVVIRMEPVLLSPASSARFPRWFWLAQAVVSMAWMVAYPLAIGRRRLARWPRFPRARTVFVEARVAVPAVFVVLLALGLFSPYLARLFGETEMPPSPLEPLARSPNRFESHAFMIMAILVAPIAEEVFFRGVLYNALRQRLHLIVAIPIQAIVFGLLHPFAAVQSAAIALIGLGIGILYEWRKTLLAPVLMHALTNGLALLLFTWGFTTDANAPRLGVYGSAHDRGCLITKVAPASAADRAGLQIGDAVTAVDGKPVTDIPSLFRIVRKRQAGDSVTVEFLRGGEARRVEAVLQRLQE